MEHKLTSVTELNTQDIDMVNGGGFWAGIGIAAAYMAVIDYSIDFGRGLGHGLYDGIHRDYR